MAVCATALSLTTGVALAAHPLAGATYRSKALRGATFKVSANGKTVRLHGKAFIEVACGPSRPPVGQSTAQLVMTAKSAPVLDVHRDGSFRGTSKRGGGTFIVKGKFTAHGKKMVFSVLTRDGSNGSCSSTPYTLRAR